jgi:hypothetical protein
MLMDVFQRSERGGNSRLATFIVLLSSMVFLPGATLFGNDPGKLSSFVSVYFSRFEMTVPAMVAKFSILCEYCESFADYCQRAGRSSKKEQREFISDRFRTTCATARIIQ